MIDYPADTRGYAPTILSAGDQTWEKLPFYAAHDVQEILIVDPEQQQVHWLALDGGSRPNAGRITPTIGSHAQIEERKAR